MSMTPRETPLLLSPLRFDPVRVELQLIDQLRLPGEEVWHRYTDYRTVAEAITTMVVRGAPAIGIAAAFGVVLGVRQGAPLDEVIATLRRTRPTAVNLFWALDRMQRRATELPAVSASPAAPVAIDQLVAALTAEAQAIWDEDVGYCLRMADFGAPLLPPGNVLTHCNAGGLATGGYGTAVGVIRTAFAQGHIRSVFADETRPFLQGARLTAYELQKAGVPVTVLCDSMAGHLMARGEIQSVIVGADRIAANGDIANKIGTYSLAVLACAHGIPFFVAAPRSTLDLSTASGSDIPIEERSSRRSRSTSRVQLAPHGVPARHPAFDITPARLVTAIITDAGVARAPYRRQPACVRSSHVEDKVFWPRNRKSCKINL
jgi:methylthioribose-1-phosphate isomerase